MVVLAVIAVTNAQVLWPLAILSVVWILAALWQRWTRG